MKKYRIYVLFSIFVTLIISSCEVGLGDAVDTEPPSLNISYPASGSVIRDWFYVSGNCSDDVSVSSVVVKVSALDGKYENGKKLIGTYNAEIDNKEKIYYCKLNNFNIENTKYNGWEFADGKYDISVIAYDDSGRTSGTSSISVNIDNTAPLMILTTPGSNSPNEPNQAPSEFGTSVRISGTIVDDNTVKSLRMRAYDTKPVDFNNLPPTDKDWTETSINTAGGTEVVFAQYNSEDALGDRYASLYPESSTGDKFYNLCFEVTDESKLYQDYSEEENNTTGNTTSNFFFNDGVSSEWNNEENGLDYKKVLQIINGTTSITDESKIISVKNAFVEKKQNYATCKINKDASPKYSVLGYSLKEENFGLDKKDNVPSASGGGAITVQAQMGRNKNTIKPDTLKVFQIGPFNYVTKEIANAVYAKVSTDTKYLTNHTDKFKDDFGAYTNIDVEQLYGTTEDEAKKNNSASSELYPYSVKASPSVKGGSCYIVAATGKDSQGKGITSDGYYVFKGSTSEVPPTIEWSSEKIENVNDVADRGYTNTAALKFGGSYSTTSDITVATYKVEIKGENGTPNPSGASISGNVNYSGGNSGTWSIDLSQGTGYPTGGIAPDKEYLYTITVTMVNAGGSSSNSHKIHVDTKSPTIDISAISPIIENEKDGAIRQFVNGKIKIQGSVEDTCLSDVNLEVYYSESNELLTTIPLGKTFTINEVFNANSEYNGNPVRDDGDFEIRVIATDEAGNRGSYTTTQFNDNVPLYLLKETDKPVLSPNNFSKITNINSIREEINVFDTGSNNKISGTITDDDGLNKIYITYYLSDGITPISATTSPNLTACGLSANPVVIEAKNTTSYSMNQKMPSKDGIYWIDIKATDTDGFTEERGAAEICEKFCIGIDSASPKIKETSVNTEAAQYVKANGSLVFSGTVSDSWEIDSLGVSIKNGEQIPISINTDKTWSYTFSSSDFENTEGEYDLVFKVKDRAGKEASVTRNINIDITPPSISSTVYAEPSYENTKFALGTSKQWVQKNSYGSIIGYDISLASQQSSTQYWYNVNQIPVKAIVNDEAGIASVECCTDYDPITGNGSWSSFAKESDCWSGSATCNSQGSNTITVRVKDNAGNENQDSFTVNVDTKEPDGLTNKLINNSSAETVYVTTNGDVNIKVKASDNGTVGTTSSGVGLVYYEDIKATYSNDEWNLLIPWSTIQGFSSTTTAVKLKISDKVGNEVSEKVVTIQRDSLIPTGVVTELVDADDAIDGTQINKTVKISGTAYDDLLLKSVSIEYNTNPTGVDTTWTLIQKITTEPEPSSGVLPKVVYGASTSDIANWKVDFDTTTVSDGNYYIRAYVEDASGNKGYKKTGEDTIDNTIAIQVNQNSDRPKVYLTNLELPTTSGTVAYLKNTKTLSGVVTDDDGIKTFSYSLDGSTWVTPSLSGGGSWNINVSNEGANTVYFKIKDKMDNEFVSGNTQLAEPKITDGTTTIEEGDCTLSFNVVTKKPDGKNFEYSVYNSQLNTWSGYSQTLRKVGGIYTKIRMKLTAQSANEIDTIKASFNGGEQVLFTCDDNINSPSFDKTSEHSWTSGDIIIGGSSSLSGTRQMEIEIMDKAEMSLISSVTVIVDNTAPQITISKPSSLISSAETIRGTVDEDSTLYYAVSRYQNNAGNAYFVSDVQPNSETANRTGSDSGSQVVLSTPWVQLESEESTANWYVFFDDGTDVDHTKKIATYLTESYLGITTEAQISAKVNPFDTVTPLYFWIKAIDECGNEQIVYKDVLVDPQGERPSVELSYPVNENDEPPTLGGTIRMTGTASDNNSPKYVWIQIDTDNDGDFDRTDLALLNTNNGSSRTYGYKLGQISTNTEKSIGEIASVISSNNNISDYGIMVSVKGSGWNQSINTAKEFNPTGEGKATLGITLYATDEDDDGTIHISLPVKQTIMIDARNPYIELSSLKLVQYKNPDGTICTDGSVKTGTEGASQTYIEGMSVSGIWFLKGTIKDDDSGIKTISFNNQNKVTNSGTSYSMDSTGLYFTNVNSNYNGATIHNYNFQIPLGSNESGKVGTSAATIYAVENTDNNLYIDTSFSVIFDNKAPVFTNDTTSPFYRLDENIQNSNGFYTFGSIASEDSVNDVAQSGVDKIAFFFTRDLNYNLYNKNNSTYNKHKPSSTATHDLFDIMIYHSGNETTDVSSGNMIVDYSTDSSLKYEDGLYWKKYNGVVDGTSFTYSGTPDVNIHSNGLAKVNGVIYEIESVSGNVITISGEPGDGSTSVYFAICNVIDNSGEKNSGVISSDHGYGYGYYGARSTDDGDLITETFTNQGTDWIFDASINSKNIPDGPITVHIIAFDKAGNSIEKTYEGVVSNNAPRIAGMKIGTDENGDGVVSASELNNSYSGKYTLGYDSSNNAITEITFPQQIGNTPKSLLTVKGALQVQPELVGGNGDISYTYSVYDYDANMQWKSTAEYQSTTPVRLGVGTTDQIVSLERNIDISVSDFIGKTNGQDSQTIKDGNNKKFKFSFGDSTPGTTISGGISNNASIEVVMNVSIRETNRAKNWILPFYWKNHSNNSLFLQSKNNGHIELIQDLPSEIFTSTGSGVYDLQPKVSGMIKLEGIAQDDSLLRDIKVSFGRTFGSVTANTDITIASYNESTGSWTTTALSNNTIPSSGWASEVRQATYQDLLDVGIELTQEDQNAISTGAKLVTNNVIYNSQDYGHIVHWIMYIDTSKVNGVAAVNVGITAKASDRGVPKWNSSTNAPSYTANTTAVTNNTIALSGGTTAGGQLSGNYVVDIVPYISSITTTERTKSGLKDANIRSASGKYSVIKGTESEFITLSGFNFNSSTVTIGTGTKAAALSSSTKNTNTIKVTNNISQSGLIEVSTNGVISLNNINNNDSHGSYALQNSVATVDEYQEMQNREADYNKTKNVLLTDDRYIRVFDMKQTGVQNGYYPNMIMNGDNPVFGYLDNNGGPGTNVGTDSGTGAGSDYNTNAHAQRAEFSGDDASEVYTEYLVKQLATEQMAMAVDEGGKYYNVTLFNYDGGGLGLYYDRYQELHPSKSGDCWGPGTGYSNYTGKYAYDLNNNAIVLETTNYDSKLLLNRYQYPKLITKGNSTDGNASVYLSYFDAATKQICFRDFMIGNNDTQTIDDPENYSFQYAGTANRIYYFSAILGLDGKYVKISNRYYKLTYNRDYGLYSIADNPTYSNFTSYLYSNSNGTRQKISNTLENTSVKVNMWENRFNDNTYSDGRIILSNNASQYFSMDVTSDNHVIIVYYDENESRLVMKYSTNAVDGSNPTANVEWTTSTISFPEYVGNYVSIALDSGDGIHIAAFDSGDSDLSYIYVPSYNASTCTRFTVDQSGAVGNWAQIKVDTRATIGTEANPMFNKPVIAYTNATENGQRDAIKLASPNGAVTLTAEGKSTIGTISAGVDSETGYTLGGWEYMTVPAITPPQGGDSKFQNVCLDFDSKGKPVVGYLGEYLEFGKWLDE